MRDLPPNRELVPVPELPAAISALAIEHVRRFCVSKVVATDLEVEGAPCAGVLCTINGVAGILTAWHIWDRLSRARTLVLMLGPKNPYRIERSVLHAYASAQTRAPDLCEAMVPDIAFFPISSRDKAVVDAKQKAFYSIDRRRNEEEFDLFGDAGFWVAVGTPVEMMRRDAQAVGSLSYTACSPRFFNPRSRSTGSSRKRYRASRTAWAREPANSEARRSAGVRPLLRGLQSLLSPHEYSWKPSSAPDRACSSGRRVMNIRVLSRRPSKSFDTDTQRQGAAWRALVLTPGGALPLRAGRLRR